MLLVLLLVTLEIFPYLYLHVPKLFICFEFPVQSVVKAKLILGLKDWLSVVFHQLANICLALRATAFVSWHTVTCTLHSPPDWHLTSNLFFCSSCYHLHNHTLWTHIRHWAMIQAHNEKQMFFLFLTTVCGYLLQLRQEREKRERQILYQSPDNVSCSDLLPSIDLSC